MIWERLKSTFDSYHFEYKETKIKSITKCPIVLDFSLWKSNQQLNGTTTAHFFFLKQHRLLSCFFLRFHRINPHILSATSGTCETPQPQRFIFKGICCFSCKFSWIWNTIWLSVQARPSITGIAENTCLKLGLGFLKLYQYKSNSN